MGANRAYSTASLKAVLGGPSHRPIVAAKRASFLADLSHEDLTRLREVVRRVHARHAATPITDRKCDMIIEGLAPAVRQRILKQFVDKNIADLGF